MEGNNNKNATNKNIEAANAEKIENKEENNKVDMNGFTFYFNDCEEKLNLFLEERFSNKTAEELKYMEDPIIAEKHNANKEQKNDNDNDNNSNVSSDNNFFEKNIIKSNYDKIAVQLVEDVEQFMKPFVNERYKIIIQAVLGENQKQGVHIASKSLWNVETDNYVSAKFVNDFIFVNIMVFVLYNE